MPGRRAVYKTFLFKSQQRFAHRATAGTKAQREFRLAKTLPWLKCPLDQRLPDLEIRFIL